MKKILSVILAVIILLSTQMVAFADNTKKIITISAPEMIVYGETSEYTSTVRYDIVIYDWLQYSEIILTISYNEELLIPVYKHYPAIAGVYMPPVSDSVDNGTRICKIKPTELAGYPAEKDFCYDIRFGVAGTGLHRLSIEAEAYDLDGNKVDVDLQADNDIYPEILSAEEAGVTVLESLDLKNHYAYIHYYTKVADIKEKLKSDNFRIKNNKGEILDTYDNISTDCTIEILYMDKVAFEKKICVPEDVNCDAKVNAADARLALRAAAKLENLNTIQRYAADIDGKAGITAADARLILRKAAKLD